MLKIGNKVCGSEGELSPHSAAILKLIKGASDWLAWAAKGASFTYEFPDESQLLQSMQAGLHGTSLLLLPATGILLSPLKLLELSDNELKALLAVETAGETNTVAGLNVKKSLAARQIWSQADLAVGDQLLVQANVGREPLFQALSLADRLALFELVHGASTEISLNPMIQKEAAAFAAGRARNIMEFVDYYRFFLTTLHDPAPQEADAAKRARLAETSAEALEPLLFPLLTCAVAQGVPSLNELASILKAWVAKGNRVGFGRLSSALCQLSENVDMRGATGAAAQKIIEQHMEELQMALLQQRPASMLLSQDGANRYYRFPSPPISAEMCLSPEGHLTVSSLSS